MKGNKKLAVFCASSNNIADKYFETARHLADFMTENGFGLVFGGANVGLMKTVANKVYNAGLPVIGIIPRFFVKRGLASECSTEIILTDNMQQRKQLLISKADAFVILPGGYGTLDELLEVITLRQIGQIKKPVVVFDEYDFYNDLYRMFDKVHSEGFADDRKYFHVAGNKEDLDKYLKTVL